MGRQITASLAPLLNAGCRLSVINHGEVDAYLRVETPTGQIINSDDSSFGSLTFDCRDKASSHNGWMEHWLIYQEVPYAHG